MDFSPSALRAARSALRGDLARRASARRAAPCSAAESALLSLFGIAAADAEAADAGAGAGDASPRAGDAGGVGGDDDAAEASRRELHALVATALLAETPFEAVDSAALHRRLAGGPLAPAARYAALGGASALADALRELAGGAAPALEVEEYTQRGEARLMVLDVDAARLALCAAGGAARTAPAPQGGNGAAGGGGGSRKRGTRSGKTGGGNGDDLESLLAAPTFKEKQARADGAELAALLSKPTAREAAAAQRFRSVGGSAVTEYCPHLTRDECRKARGRAGAAACGCVHFVRLMMPHTDTALGDCNFLDTCRHMRTCKYVHYAMDQADAAAAARAGGGGGGAPSAAPGGAAAEVPEALAACAQPQWLNCDVRSFDLALLGQFGVVMADPPWDIHMDLPYGTMADDEMRQMGIGSLQQEGGVMFLWVTGRAMELGRECLALWGYRFVQELVWVKTNQLQRIIRTGRTGHWLNHSKEHCLVGVKGTAGAAGALQLNRRLDTDVLVAEVRETSRKPDEMYSLLERLSPGTRKLEVFGREHNTRPGWVTLGNQLPGVRLHEEPLRRRFLARYPDRAHELSPPADT